MSRSGDYAGAIGARMRIIRFLLIFGIGIFVLTMTAKISVAGVYRNVKPDIALQWMPADSFAKARVASDMLAARQDRATADRAERLAVEALRRDPTTVGAVRVLGVVAEIKGQRTQAVRLLNEAQRLSRRDLLTQLWFIEYNSQKGDVGATLKHYDIALRTNRHARDLLYPILLNATADPELVGPIGDVLAQREGPWWFEFTSELIRKGPNPDNAAQIVGRVLDPRNPTEVLYLANLIERLVHARAYPAAWRTYADLKKKVGDTQTSALLLRNGTFSFDDVQAPIEWQFLSDGKVDAQRRLRANSDTDQVLALNILGGDGGVAARQLLHLSPGKYNLSFEAGDLPQAAGDRPMIVISCIVAGQTESRALLSLVAERVGARPSRTAGSFLVSDGCNWQWIHILARGDTPTSGDAPWVDNITLVKRAGTD